MPSANTLRKRPSSTNKVRNWRGERLHYLARRLSDKRLALFAEGHGQRILNPTHNISRSPRGKPWSKASGHASDAGPNLSSRPGKGCCAELGNTGPKRGGRRLTTRKLSPQEFCAQF
jgi:hypothetical protein